MYARVFILLHRINFHSLFQLCPTYFLSVNALPAWRSQLLRELWRSQLLRKLVKITFLHTLSMMLRYFSPQAEWKPEAENSADHSVCRIQTIYVHVYFHVYIECKFTPLYWRMKNTCRNSSKVWCSR